MFFFFLYVAGPNTFDDDSTWHDNFCFESSRLEIRVLSSSANGELYLNMSPAYYCLPLWPPNYNLLLNRNKNLLFFF